jgi:hypothetical protein
MYSNRAPDRNSLLPMAASKKIGRSGRKFTRALRKTLSAYLFSKGIFTRSSSY